MDTVIELLEHAKPGIGLVAVHGGIPIVPVWLQVHRPSRIDEGLRGETLRGEVEVVFGAPLRFDPEGDPAAATEEIRDAVAALAPPVRAPRPSITTRPSAAGRASP